MLARDHTLRRPRTLFTVGLVTLFFTLILSYERIKSSSFSLFYEPVISADSLLPLSDDERNAYQSIFDEIGPMSYGTSHRPPMKGLPKDIIATLPDKLVPHASNGSDHVKRIIIIGDVHGHKHALQDLLDKLQFNSSNDSVVFTGDLVNKGPDSAGVVELAMKLGAHGVRGNHEDRILLTHEAMNAPSFVAETDMATAALDKFHLQDNESDAGQQDRLAAETEYQESKKKLSKGDRRARKVARSLSPEQIKWLSELPIVLQVGAIPRGADHPTFENLLVVHAGLVPDVTLEDQDPWAVMNMRTVSHPTAELRREAVRKFLTERAKKRPGGLRGLLAELQSIDESHVDAELQRITESFGSDGDEEEVSLPSAGRDGTYWYEEWSRWQEKLVKKDRKKEKKGKKKGHKKHDEEPITTVVYGHDAKSGLRVPKEFGHGKKGYTFGLDSGCVYGGQLTALVIEVKDGEAVHEIVQVECEQHVDPDE